MHKLFKDHGKQIKTHILCFYHEKPFSHLCYQIWKNIIELYIELCWVFLSFFYATNVSKDCDLYTPMVYFFQFLHRRIFKYMFFHRNLGNSIWIKFIDPRVFNLIFNFLGATPGSLFSRLCLQWQENSAKICKKSYHRTTNALWVNHRSLFYFGSISVFLTSYLS